jgi:hypothetical protein
MTHGGAISVPPEHRALRRKAALAYREAMTEGLSHRVEQTPLAGKHNGSPVGDGGNMQ